VISSLLLPAGFFFETPVLITYHDVVEKAIKANRSRLCVGLDPDLEKLPLQYLPYGKSSLKKNIEYFFKEVVYATADECSAYKPQAAMFSALGCEDLLAALITWIKKNFPNHLVIFDGKRGDIGNTAKHYVVECFQRYEADATTVSPYMGLESIKPFTEKPEKGVYVLCRTSNPGADLIQKIRVPNRLHERNFMPFYEYIAEKFVEFDVRNQIGLVVGANCIDELKNIHKRFPSTPLLLPGIGSQGGKIVDVVSIIDDDKKKSDSESLGERCNNNLINLSRSVIYASNGKDWKYAAMKKVKALNVSLGSGLEY
tara:strand:+ start:111 stop:1049 length:939 start_codon:yes stop_codon:yes gene_type:complete